MFDLFAAMTGKPIVTQSGRSLKFIAYVPEAQACSRLLLLDHLTGEVHTYWDDGRFQMDRSESSLDATIVTSRTKESHKC